MPDLITGLQNAGFSQDEVQAHLTQQRDQLRSAGFNDSEIDDHFGMPKVPDGVPAPMAERFEAGAVAQKREGGLMQTIPEFAKMLGDPAGRTKLWDAVKQYPAEFAKGLLEQAELPGEVAKGNVDL